MSLRKKSLRGTALLTAGEAVIYGSSFVRNMLLARLLTKADFGIAATFAMVITVLEFSGKLGISRFVIRDREGGNPEFIGAAHFVQFAAGVVSAVVMVISARPLAGLFGLENQRWAIPILASVLLLNGLQHLDIRRFERDLRFGPSSLTEVIPQLAITLAAWPAAQWLGDYRAMLLLLIGKAVMSCASSHWLAEHPYRWRFHREYMSRMLLFGWPLLVTGFLMWGAFQGDQFLVATFYTMADLGAYAAAAALTMAPAFVFGRIFHSVMLPLMARVQDDEEAFHRMYQKATAVICVFAGVSVVGMVVASEALMVLVYGEKYVDTGVIMACLACANAFRVLRTASSLAALAKGDSKNQMISNLWRVAALLPALALAAAHKPVWMVACTGLIGEMFAGWASVIRLRRRDKMPLSDGLIPAAWIGLLAAIAIVASVAVRHWNAYAVLSVAVAGAIIVGVSMVLAMPVLRRNAAAVSSRGWALIIERRRPLDVS